MNLFRSEEHARDWQGFVPEMKHNLRPLNQWMTVFSEDRLRERGLPNYMSLRASGRYGPV